MSDLPTPLERARSLSRDRALTEQADQHAITLESILAVLRSGRLADAAARREATEIASSALIRARSVHEQRESVLEPVAEAFSRLRTELRPLIRSGPLQVQFAEPPARGRALPGPVAREARAISRTAVLSLMDRADAARARIGWDCDGRNLLMEVRDDGGTAVTADDDTLRPIVERVVALDGTMDVETTPGWGTTLRIEVPLDPPSAALTVGGRRGAHRPREAGAAPGRDRDLEPAHRRPARDHGEHREVPRRQLAAEIRRPHARRARKHRSLR